VLLGYSAVSPAEQMRFGTAEHLRRAGFTQHAVELGKLRGDWEAFQRGRLSREHLQSSIDRVAAEPWFELSWVPRTAPVVGTWADMDYDPTASMALLSCPVLAFYGETDEWLAVAESVRRWRVLTAVDESVEVHVLPGVGHDLTDVDFPAAPNPQYERTLAEWVSRRLLSS
jgi:uncharacterized protein